MAGKESLNEFYILRSSQTHSDVSRGRISLTHTLIFSIWKNWIIFQSLSDLTQWCIMKYGDHVGLGTGASAYGQTAILAAPEWAPCKFYLISKRCLVPRNTEGNNFFFCQLLFCKLPVSSRKWPGSSPSGLEDSLSLSSTEGRNVNMVVS